MDVEACLHLIQKMMVEISSGRIDTECMTRNIVSSETGFICSWNICFRCWQNAGYSRAKSYTQQMCIICVFQSLSLPMLLGIHFNNKQQKKTETTTTSIEKVFLFVCESCKQNETILYYIIILFNMHNFSIIESKYISLFIAIRCLSYVSIVYIIICCRSACCGLDWRWTSANWYPIT